MAAIRTEATLTQVALIPYVERAIEVLWILAAVLVPLIFVPKFSILSEAVNAYVEVPKTTVFRLLVGMMVILWVVEWALKGGLHKRYSMAGYSTRIWNWVAEQPSRWVVVAAIFYVTVAIISTFLSQNLWISMWGEVSGQFGYSAYTTVSYFFLFVIIATHLKTKNQLWRLLAAIVATGALVALYSIVQRFVVVYSCVVSANSLRSGQNGPERPKRDPAAVRLPWRRSMATMIHTAHLSRITWRPIYTASRCLPRFLVAA